MATFFEVHERREFNRFPVNEQGFLISADKDGDVFPVRISDVSARGIGFIANRYFTIEQKYSIQYSILSHNFHLPIKVIWIKNSPDGIVVGCRKEPLYKSFTRAG